VRESLLENALPGGAHPLRWQLDHLRHHLRRNESALDVYTEVRYTRNIVSYEHTDLQE